LFHLLISVKFKKKKSRFTLTNLNEQEPALILDTPRNRESSDSELFNLPLEIYLGETNSDYVVYLRTIPSTKLQLFIVTTKILRIECIFPPLITDEGVTLKEGIISVFKKHITFPAEIDPNSVNQVLSKETSTMVIKIKKFSHKVIGTDIVF